MLFRSELDRQTHGNASHDRKREIFDCSHLGRRKPSSPRRHEQMVDVHNDHRSAEASKEAQGIDLDLVPIVLFVFLMCNLNQQEVGVGCHLGLGVNLRLEAFFEFWEAHAKTSFLK